MLLSLREIKHDFEQRNLFNAHYEPLKRLSYGQVRFIIRKCGRRDMDLRKELIAFMKCHYPDWTDISESRFGIIGNGWIEKAVQNLVLEDRQILFRKNPLDFVAAPDYNVDYLIMDGVALTGSETGAALETPVIHDIWALCEEKGIDVIFVKTYPKGSADHEMDMRYARILTGQSWIKTIYVRGVAAGTADDGDCWDAADEIFRILNMDGEALNG
jgi:hypothetical protein